MYSDISYEELALTWDVSVDSFFKYLNIFLNVADDDELVLILKTHIKSIDDLNNWINFFDGDLNMGKLRATTGLYIDSLQPKESLIA